MRFARLRTCCRCSTPGRRCRTGRFSRCWSRPRVGRGGSTRARSPQAGALARCSGAGAGGGGPGHGVSVRIVVEPVRGVGAGAARGSGAGAVAVGGGLEGDCGGGRRGVSPRRARRLLSCALRDEQVRRKLERRAYGEREGEALGRSQDTRARQDWRRKAKCALRKARLSRFAFNGEDTLRGALECVDAASGELHRPEQVDALIAQAAGRIGGSTSARSLRGIFATARRVWCWRNTACCPGSRPWATMPAVRLGCLCGTVRACPTRAVVRCLVIFSPPMRTLQDRLGPSASLLDIEAVLHQRHRASRVQWRHRPYLYESPNRPVPRRFNLRTRRWGRHDATRA